MDIKLPHHYFLKRLFFPPKNCLGILAENQLTINEKVYFWTLTSIPLSYVSILMLTHRLDYCDFINFEVGKIEAYYLKLFCILWIYIWMYGHLVNFCKEMGWDFYKDFSEYVYQFGQYCYPNNIVSQSTCFSIYLGLLKFLSTSCILQSIRFVLFMLNLFLNILIFLMLM